MNIDQWSILLGFIEGFVLIISPCILPILPIFLAGSLNHSKKRPLGMIAGFILSFSLLAYFSRQLVHYLDIDLNSLRHTSYILLFLFGIIMIFPRLSEIFSAYTQRFAHSSTQASRRIGQGEGFFSGFLLGTLLAFVWTPCAGPVLATVIVQTVLQKTTLVSFFILFAFALGAGIPMLIISFYGRALMNSFQIFKKRALLFRQLLGLLIILSTVLMYAQEKGFIFVAPIKSNAIFATSLEQGLWRPYPAPSIKGVTTWFNSPPLALDQLKGHVVLVDFWTYSCINCIRTLPYLNAWYEKYKKQGLIIIGVHTPEFEFEKKPENVKKAILSYGIQYPVALDDQFATWQNFDNHYWPAHYLIDKKGNVVYEHFGEGAYDVTENNIRFLLGIDQIAIPDDFGHPVYSFTLTPETYLGYERANTRLSPALIPNKTASYHFSSTLANNSWELRGKWLALADCIIAKEASALRLHFNARKVYMVMGSRSGKPIHVKVWLNGNWIRYSNDNSSPDNELVITNHQLYNIIDLKTLRNGYLQIQADAPGLEVYTFTFGA